MSEHIHPDDYDLDAVREQWVGKVVSRSVGRYPVEYDPIRRHCHMTGDTNPLFIDPEFARETGPHGDVVVPPSLLPTYFASAGPWPRRRRAEDDEATPKRPGFTLGIPTPGDRGINMTTEWEFPRPIRVGDVLRSEQVVTDVFMKSIKLDDKAVWIVSEMTFFNQHEQTVALWRNTTLVHRSPKQIEADAARSHQRNKGQKP